MEQNSSSIEALLSAQKAYWQQLTSGTDTQTPEQWAEYINRSHKTFRHEAPQQFSQLLDILGAQSRNFTQFGEELLKQYQAGEDLHTHETVKQFQSYMQQQTTELLLQQWQIPEQFSSLFRTHSFRDDLMFENPFISGMKSLLDTPIVGANHELQHQVQEAIQLTLEYQEALQEYIKHYNAINQHASSTMLIELNEAKEQVSGLQQLHDIWVEAYESAYSKKVFTDEYQRSHGRISNALMRLRKYTQDVRDHHFQSVGLATRQGLDTALQRQHQLRKEMRSTQRELNEMRAQIAELQAQTATQSITNLKKEISSLKRQITMLKKAK